MKTLVLGSNGLIGSNIKLEGEVVYCTKQEVDLLQPHDLIDLLKSSKCERVINCAGDQKSLTSMGKKHFSHFVNNMMMNINTLNACVKSEVVKEIVIISSINALSDSGNLDESKIFNGQPSDGLYSDGYVKRMLHLMNRALREEYDIKCFTPLVTNVYGQKGNDVLGNWLNNGIIPFLIDKFISAKLKHEDVTVEGDGSAIRDFIFVKDLNKLIGKCLDLNIDNVVITPGNPVTILDLVSLIVEEINFKGKVSWTNKKFGNNNKYYNNNLLTSLFPNFEFTPLSRGIKETIEWYTKVRNNG